MTATGYTSNGLFEEEAFELLSDLESALLQAEETPEDPDIISRIFRALHTIKGSAAMFGYDNISAFLHQVENVFDLVRNGRLSVSRRLIDLTLSVADEVRRMLETKPGDEQDGSQVDDIVACFSAFLQNDRPHEVRTEKPTIEKRSETLTYRIRLRPHSNIFSNGTNLLPLFAELSELGSMSSIAHLDSIPSLEKIDPEACYIRWDIIFTSQADENSIRDVFIFVEDAMDLNIETVDGAYVVRGEDPDYKRLGEILLEKGDVAQETLRQALEAKKPIGEILIESGGVSPASVESALVEQKRVREIRESKKSNEAASSVRVASEKLDALVNLVGELVTVDARLGRFAAEFKDAELVSIAEEVERLTADLRDSAMSMRMLPIGTTFGRFKRLVRDLSAELGKEVELATSGASTELDKTVLERLNDPLVHLIRNSIDHGIESPEARIVAGKPRIGRVHLSASHSGAHVVIEIEDDGAGLDKEKLKEKAIAKGVIPANAQLSERDAFNLIFVPGFSTAEKVSAVSGRGVGMDVVKTSLEALRGSIEIESARGRGTRIRLKLPLTLAIIEGLLVGIGDAFFVLPVSFIEECVEIKTGENGRGGQRSALMDVRGGLVPCINLRSVYLTAGERPSVQQAVIVKAGAQKVGLVVDNVVGEMQAVMKNLGSMYRKTEGISGATILGDGRIALIVDVQQLVETMERQEAAGG